MPCDCYGYEPSEEDLRRAQAFKILCAVLEKVEKTNPELIKECDEISDWWESHKKADNKRKKEQAEYEEYRRSEKLKQLEQLKKESNIE